MIRPAPRSSLFPYATRFRSGEDQRRVGQLLGRELRHLEADGLDLLRARVDVAHQQVDLVDARREREHALVGRLLVALRDRKSTRLNSSHPNTSYAVFCLKKK